jgi:hypothetical protein
MGRYSEIDKTVVKALDGNDQDDKGKQQEIFNFEQSRLHLKQIISCSSGTEHRGQAPSAPLCTREVPGSNPGVV